MLDTFSRLAIALGLGLLVGLQRQRTDARLAGFRTFPLVALLGAVCGLLAQTFGGWVLFGGLLSLALVLVGGNLPLLRFAKESPGITTEAALLVMFVIGGYLAYKFTGDRAGAWATGVLGGLISSTATTVSLARRSKESPVSPHRTAFVILIASTVVFLRLAILVGTTAPQFLKDIAVPFAIMAIAMGGLAWLKFAPRESEPPWIPEQTNPTELKPAILFGLLYAAVLLAVAVANERFGHGGLYVTAMVSGLTDMDAITLSVAQLVASGEVGSGMAWRFIVVAAMANLVFKGVAVALLADRKTFDFVALGFGASLLAGAALLVIRP